MTGSFDALFDSFEHTVFRLEALPAYAVGGAEAERLRAFRDGQPRPERSVRTSPWLARIAVTTATAGKAWSRVRVLDDPLNDYQRYQLESYRESQAAGEAILIVRRSDVADVNLDPDFWLFDEGTSRERAALMRYAPDGRFEGFELVSDPEQLAGLCAVRAAVAGRAVPLNVFLAREHAGV